MSSRRKSTDGLPWKQQLASALQVYGHRNWIIIADAAYPQHAHHGVTTVTVEADLLNVVDRVLSSIKRSQHLRSNIYIDEELEFVDERDVPDIDEFNRRLITLFGAQEFKRYPHKEIIDLVVNAAEHFSVLVLKTSTLKAYSSVFIELGCGYWTEEAEQRMRKNVLRSKSAKSSELSATAIRAV
jgi:L-fucose mutarotase/ribose pyranase (RbsD/FucU family)